VHLYRDETAMVKFAGELGKFPQPDFRRILTQLGRELLLEQASDWQFLISTWSARDYAEARFSEHHDRFVKISNMADKFVRGENITPEEWNYLIAVEKSDDIFPDIKPEIWL